MPLAFWVLPRCSARLCVPITDGVGGGGGCLANRYPRPQQGWRAEPRDLVNKTKKESSRLERPRPCGDLEQQV